MKKILLALAIIAPLAAVIHVTASENGRMHAERIAAEAEQRGREDFIREQQMEATRAKAWLASRPMRRTVYGD